MNKTTKKGLIQATQNKDNTTSQAIDTPQKTISIIGLENDFNGYCVVVGTTKGSGVFRYVLGDEKEAIRIGELMKEQEAKFFFNWGNNKHKELFVEMRKVKLSKCKMEYCENLCEDDYYCDRCEDSINDARIDYEEYSKSKCGELEYG